MSNASRQVARALRTQEGHGENGPPETVDAGDFWRLQAKGSAVARLQQEQRAVQAELRALQQEHEQDSRAFCEKYGIDPKVDSVDMDTLKINRGPRPAPAAVPSPAPVALDEAPPK